MSIIQGIRDRGAWIIFGVIALALIAFILQDGLNRRGSLFGSGSTVGKINGTKINKAEFDKKVEAATRGNNAQAEYMRQQMWNQEIMQVLLQEEIEKLGLTCSPKELSEELFKPNSPLMNEFKNPETGQYDVEAAKQAFANIKKSKKADQQNEIYEYLIKPVILQTLNNKFNAIISQAAYAPKWLVEKQQAENNSFSTVSYVAVPYSTIADSTVKVSDDEILAYAKKNSKLYEKDEETRVLQFVTFDATPSQADSAAVKTKLETLKQDMQNTADMKLFFAKNNTVMAYYGGFISKKEIKQAQKDTLLKMSAGSVFGPYLDGNNYVLAKMVDIKNIPDSAKVRHILISTMKQDPQTGQSYRFRDDSTAKHLADTIQMELAKGKSFDSLCLKYSEDPGSSKKGGVYDFFASGRMVGSFNDFSFNKPVGSKGIVQTEFGYHYIEVLAQKGNDAAYNIAYLAKPITVSNETDIAIKNEASLFLSKAKNRKQFDEEVAKLKKTSVPSGEIKATDANISGLGSNRMLVKWVYDNNVGDITKEYYDVANKYVVGVVAAINKPGIPSAQTLRPQIEILVKNEKKAKQIISTKFKGNTLESFVAATPGTAIQKIDTLLYTQPFVPGLGASEPKFAGAAFNATNKGKVTEPLAGSNGVFAIRVENIGAKASAGNNDNIKQTLKGQISNAAYRAIENLKKAASITDNRADLY